MEAKPAIPCSNPLLGKRSFINYVRVPTEGEVGKISTYSCFGGVKPILMYYFPSQYFIIKMAQSSGLSRIIFPLCLKGKKLIRMSCFLLVLQRINSVKYNKRITLCMESYI